MDTHLHNIICMNQGCYVSLSYFISHVTTPEYHVTVETYHVFPRNMFVEYILTTGSPGSGCWAWQVSSVHSTLATATREELSGRG